MLVMIDRMGLMILVQSSLPPRPVSITAISTFISSKYLKAIAVVSSKNDGRIGSKNERSFSIKSMISLSDGRIAVHDEDTIYIGRYGTRRDIKFDIEIRHNNTINSLCKLDNDNILACGAMTIDVYNDTYKKIAEISTEESINKVLAIANERFVVCCEQSIFVYLRTHLIQKASLYLQQRLLLKSHYLQL